jgi:hypothetical protein
MAAQFRAPALQAGVSQGMGFFYAEVFTCFFVPNPIGQERST